MFDILRKFRSSVSALALCAGLGAMTVTGGPAQAQDVIVPIGTTVGQQILGPGESIFVSPGARAVDPAVAIFAPLGFQSGTNRGTISAGAVGVFSGASIVDFQNFGIIEGGSVGVQAALSIGSLSNSGRIAGGAVGVFSGLTIGTLDNSGTITGGSVGVQVGAALNTFTNSGRISGGAVGVFGTAMGAATNFGTINGGIVGVQVATSLGSFTNYGTINGGASVGLSVGTTADRIVNFGMIRGGVIAIQAGVGIRQLVNGGRIIARNPGGFAILSGGVVDTELVLLPGSVIDGFILLGGGTNTLMVENGLSIVNTFLFPGPQRIDANGAPYVSRNTAMGVQIAVVDPTNLAAQDEILADLTGGILNTVGDRLFLVQAMLAEQSSAERGRLYASAERAPEGGSMTGREWSFWLRGFGAFRRQDADRPTIVSEHRMGGGVAGADAPFFGGTRAGLFFGGAVGRVDAKFDSQSTDWSGIFGGGYLSVPWRRYTFDVSLAVGGLDYDRSRRVANNMAPGGLQRAKADYNGFFVSPELTVSRPVTVSSQRVVPSATLRYAGLFLDGFTETGASDNLTIGSRDIHVGTARLQIAVPFVRKWYDGAVTRVRITVGTEARVRFGDRDVSGTLLGQRINFDPGGDRAVGAVFGSIGVLHQISGGFHLFVGGELKGETNASFQVSGQLGLRYVF